MRESGRWIAPGNRDLRAQASLALSLLLVAIGNLDIAFQRREANSRVRLRGESSRRSMICSVGGLSSSACGWLG